MDNCVHYANSLKCWVISARIRDPQSWRKRMLKKKQTIYIGSALLQLIWGSLECLPISIYLQNSSWGAQIFNESLRHHIKTPKAINRKQLHVSIYFGSINWKSACPLATFLCVADAEVHKRDSQITQKLWAYDSGSIEKNNLQPETKQVWLMESCTKLTEDSYQSLSINPKIEDSKGKRMAMLREMGNECERE